MSPQKTDLRRSILNSQSNNWEFIDTPETWVLWSESLTIEEIGMDGHGSRRNISQPDFANLPDQNNDEETQIRIAHSGVPIDQLPALNLDGGRIFMIQPDTDHSTGDRYLTQYESQLSKVMSMDNFQRKQGNSIDVEVRSQAI